jgi:transposase
MRPTHPATLSDISNRLALGQSSRRIAAAVGVSKTVVNNLRKKLPDDIPRLKGGQPAKLSARERAKAARLMASGRCQSATQVAEIINRGRRDPVCVDTVRNALKAQDWVAYRPNEKPRLQPHHRRARRNWALAHKDWAVPEWMRVIWSDEQTEINRIGSGGHRRKRVKREKGLTERLCQRCLRTLKPSS